MKLISAIIIFLSISMTYVDGQDFISIKGKCPFPANSMVSFEGYQGFEIVDLGEIRISADSIIDYFTDYHGYCLMKVKGSPSMPLILDHDPTCIEWDSLPGFPCDPENKFYYEMRTRFMSLDTLVPMYLNSNDSLEQISLKKSIHNQIEKTGLVLDGQTSLCASVLLKAELMIIESSLVENAEGMGEHKVKITDFIDAHYDQLLHSDMLTSLAIAYTDMNRKVFTNPLSTQQAIIYDVGEWVNMLGPRMGEKDVINFFLVQCSKQGDKEIASILVAKYIDIVKCEQYVSSNTRPTNIPYSFSIFGGPDLSRVKTLDQFQGISKILAVYSTECPATIAAVVGLYSFMGENQIRMPVILMPDNVDEGPLNEIVKKQAPFGMQTGMKTGGGFMQGAGVKQLPAFIILDERNLLKKIYYDFNELKAELLGD